MIDVIKTTVISFLSILFTYLDPVAGNLESLLCLFVLNFFVGYVTGMIKNNESFQMKKFLMALIWAMVILILICCFYFIGERNGNKAETLDFVRWVSLIAIWAFGCNILRNFRILSRGTGVYFDFFDALYTGISLEFIKKLPFLAKVKNNNKDEVQRNENKHCND